MDNLVTFIIVTWNNEKEIVNCLTSIQKYSPEKSQIIVVDNVSTDNTVKIIESDFQNVTLIKNLENLGFARANNIALEKVNTEYICYLNPDTVLTEDIIVPSIKVLKENQDIGIVACSLKNSDGSHQQSSFAFANSRTIFTEVLHIGRLFPSMIQKRYFLEKYIPRKNFSPDWVIGAEMVLRTKEAKLIGGFSTEYFMYTEDMDICKKMSYYLNKTTFLMTHVSLIHIGGASEAQNFNYVKQRKLFENTLVFVEKFYGVSESKRTLKNMIFAYQIRLLILKCFYFKIKRAVVIDKTKKAISILKEMS